MAITATITKAELNNRTVASVVQSGITFNSYQTSPFFMYLPPSGSDTFDNKVELTVSGIEFGAPSLPVKIYASKTNNWETIVTEGLSAYLLHSTTISTNDTFTYTVTLTSGQLPPSDCYYIFAVIDDGGLYHTVSAYQTVTISSYEIYEFIGYGALPIMEGGLEDAQLISESVIGFIPKILMIDVTWNVTRSITQTANLEEFNGTNSTSKIFLLYNQYTNNFECLSVTNAKTLSGTQLSETYKDTNKIYLYHDGTSYPLTISYMKGYGILVTSDLNPTVPNEFVFQYYALGGHALQAQIVQSNANVSTVSFNMDPNALFVVGGCGPIDGGDAKRSYSTNNYALSFAVADRTTNQHRTACYANYSGVCKSYIDATTDAVVGFSPTAGADNYKITLDSFTTNTANVTFSGNSSFNSYIYYYIALHFPKNGKFQNVSLSVSSTSAIDFVFSNNVEGFFAFHNYSKNDGTCYYHDGLSTSLSEAYKNNYSLDKKLNYYSQTITSCMSGYFVKKGDTTQQYNYFGNSNFLYNRADDIINHTTDNSINSRINVSPSGATISSTIFGGGSYTLGYNISCFSLLKDNSTNYYITNIYSNSSFTSGYTSQPALLIKHDDSFIAYSSAFQTTNTSDYRFYLSKTIDMSTDDVLDITSLISSFTSTTITFSALNTLTGTEKFYNQSTCYFITNTKTTNNIIYNKPIIITTNSASDFRTYTNSSTIDSKQLIFDESANGFKFGAAIITVTNNNTMPYDNNNNGSSLQSTILVSYNYHSKILKTAFFSSYIDDSVSRFTGSTSHVVYSYDYLRHGLAYAASGSPFYSTNYCDFQYIPGEGLYMKGPSSTVAYNMLAFGGPALLSDVLTNATTITSHSSAFLPSLAFIMNGTSAATASENLVVSNTNYSYGMVIGSATPKAMCISNRYETTAGGTRTVTVSNAHMSRQQLSTAYSLGYVSRTHSPTSATYRYSYSYNGDGDMLYDLCLFFGSIEATMILKTIAWPAAGASSSSDHVHAISTGAQAVIGLSINQESTATPANNTAYTNGSFMLGWGSANKTGTRYGCIEQGKVFATPTAYYTQRITNANYIKTVGQNTSYVSNAYRTIDVTNFKKGSGPYDIEHSYASSASSTGSLYSSLIEVAIPVGNGQLIANGPLEMNYNFSEGMKFDFHRVSTDTILEMSYTFGSMSIDYGPVIENPISLSYTFGSISIDNALSLVITPITLSYTLNDLTTVQGIEVGTPLSLSYTFGSMSIENTVSIEVTPITLTYSFDNYSVVNALTIGLSPVTLTYSFENNSLTYNNSFSITPITLDYTFGSMSFDGTIVLDHNSPVSLSYTFENNSLTYANSISITPITLTYSFENNLITYANSISITTITLTYSFENNSISNALSISITPITLDYTFQTYSFSYHYNLEQINQIYLDYSFENNPLTYNNSFSITPITLDYTFGSMAFGNIINLEHNTPISLTYSFENNSISNALSISITPITLDYTFGSMAFGNIINLEHNTPISLTYSFENNSISNALSISITPITLDYTFGSMAFGGNINIQHDTPITLTYSFENNSITYNNTFSVTPITLSYGFESYILSNGIILLHNSPLANYIIIENNSLTYNNTFSIIPITLTYSFENNSLTYNNSFSITPITLSYGFQTYDFVHSKTLSLTELTMNINIQNDMLVQVAGNIILPISPIEMSYNFGTMSFPYYPPLNYNFDDPIRNYIIFQNDMILTTKPPTYLSQDNPSPWQFASYTFGSMSFAYGTPTILIHNSPALMTYSFGTFGMHVSANYIIAPLSLSYTFSDNMNMKVDQLIVITPFTLTYNFQTYVLENDTNVDQLTPLVMSYNFGTMSFVNNKTFIITPITLKIDFNESNMFFDYHRNNINYESLFIKFNTTNYFISIQGK